MSQQQKLEQVLDLLINEDSDQAAELLHQIIVEKARVIYESIVDEEADEEVDEAKEDDDEKLDEAEEVGGEPSKDFTDEISSDTDEIDSDEQNDGEAEGDDDSESDGESDGEFGDFGDEEEMSTEEKVQDLEAQLASLRAEFDALMGEEFQEPNHADLPGQFDDMEQDMGADIGDEGGADMGETVSAKTVKSLAK